MSHNLLLRVTVGVLTLLQILHSISPHPLRSTFQHPPRAPGIADENTLNDNTPDMLQSDVKLAKEDVVQLKLLNNWEHLHNLLLHSYALAQQKPEWQKLKSFATNGAQAYRNQAPVEIETVSPSSSPVRPTVTSRRTGAQPEVDASTAKRSAPLEYHMIPPEVVAYVLQGWRDHSARQAALEAALEDAGMKLPAGWRGRDDLSVGLDVEVLKVVIADMNRHLHQGQQRDTQNKLARIGKRHA